jgi:NAD(P)H-dependent FMN reductase
MQILALSGSLRAESMNSALLRAAARLAPVGVRVNVYEQLGALPLFNPDSESQLPAPVAHFHALVESSDAVMIASPEYAHGVTGTIKNALDWLVSFEPFVNKPVAVLNASPRARHADTALREILKTMAAVIVEPASITIPILSSGLTEIGMVYDPAVSDLIMRALSALYGAVAGQASAQGPVFPLA